MALQLSQKERMLLEDDKAHEELCVTKYKNYANQAQAPQLKQLFNKLATEEQQHYNTITTMLAGQEPNMTQPQQQATQTQQSNQMQQTTYQGAMSSAGDKDLCSDMLSTEKYISGLYDTGVFEACNPTVRQALQHIQKEEQAHGEQIFNYMNSNGMYPVK